MYYHAPGVRGIIKNSIIDVEGNPVNWNGQDCAYVKLFNLTEITPASQSGGNINYPTAFDKYYVDPEVAAIEDDPTVNSTTQYIIQITNSDPTSTPFTVSGNFSCSPTLSYSSSNKYYSGTNIRVTLTYLYAQNESIPEENWTNGGEWKSNSTSFTLQSYTTMKIIISVQVLDVGKDVSSHSITISLNLVTI